MMRAVLLAGVAAVASSASVSSGDHPIAGVIGLLQRLEVQAQEEGAAEANLFQKFVYWCKTSEKTLTKAIEKEKTEVSSLTDTITGLKSDVNTLGEKIEKLDEELTQMNNAAAKAKKVRADEHALYKSEQGNFVDTIDAVDEAVDVMEDSETSLIKKKTKVMRKAVFLAAPTAPEASKYDFKSGGIVETFKGMNTEFEGDKLDATEQETNKLNAYNLAKQARDHAISTAEASKGEKESIKSDKESDLANAQTSKSQEEKALAADSTSLEDTQTECTTKSAEWDTRSDIRSNEIKALKMAQKILTKVTGVRNPDTHEIAQKSLSQVTANIDQDTASFNQAIAFIQIEDPRTKAVNLLKKAASKAHSKSLQKLAQEISTYKGPFDQIKQMIQKMVFRLMAEQKDEDDQKNWCDLETEKSTESKTDKKDKMTLYQDKISEMTSKKQDLITKISENDDKVKEINEYQTEETDMRNENHAEIKATIKDSQDAQAAVTQAMSVLRDFYKKSGMIAKEPWEFLQKGRRGVDLPDSPDTWDSSYTGAADPKAGGEGVLAILDGVMQKFSQMEADSKVADETDGKNFDADMAAKKVEMEEIKMDSQMKTTKKDSLQEKVEGMSGQLKHTTSEFDAVKQYLKDLEPACGTGDSSYGDRKQARTDEIEALRKAQGILEEAFRG